MDDRLDTLLDRDLADPNQDSLLRCRLQIENFKTRVSDAFAIHDTETPSSTARLIMYPLFDHDLIRLERSLVREQGKLLCHVWMA
jgi:hypothetical protein